MKQILPYLLAGTICLGGGSCKKEDETAQAACKAKSDVLMRADKWKGRVVFDSVLQAYVVSYFVPGSIDSVYDGIVCALPAELRQVGQLVTFSGQYRAYTGPANPQFGGQQYFYLELTSITAR
ncbi:hypothetical protein MUN84_00935 [Hymenobacter sp. 5516J-16]|uniref:hypothetical protein n=1 Tax=Hymenobacter sp. 5516J-16 TaxID=2932253 RepID=UPI001FD07233|nr:hypothetical protein [Hymenobacter sp. 5516J-16]UOQ77324.1 hypothetical protein MUN84_00935 [Hymenobacter sp. 5516J-16]